MRKYTIKEIDQMRSMVNNMCVQHGKPYKDSEKKEEIELKLRTYLNAGITPAALKKEYEADLEDKRRHSELEHAHQMKLQEKLREQDEKEWGTKEQQESIVAAKGLMDELRPSITKRPFRCASCSRMVEVGDIGAWLPGGVRKGDSVSSVTSRLKACTFNSHSSKWGYCCAKKFKKLKSDVDSKTVHSSNVDEISSNDDGQKDVLISYLFFAVVLAVVFWIFIQLFSVFSQ